MTVSIFCLTRFISGIYDVGMYGKHFASMYSGSMIGAGAIVFAVMGYVISHQKPDKEIGMSVELNPKLLGPILGEPVESVVAAIEKLCAPDDDSRTKDEQGRRLVKVGQFDYRVVNGLKYRDIFNEEERRRQNREAKRRERQKKPSRKRGSVGQPLPGETEYVAAMENGEGEERLDEIVGKHLPK